jgi:EAL domain-containing protein (putative c-di-GMP-specific phosphodiesterase class I)
MPRRWKNCAGKTRCTPRWQSPELGRVMLSDFIPILDVVEDDSAVKVGKTIIDLGHALDMTVIAEGVETE